MWHRLKPLLVLIGASTLYYSGLIFLYNQFINRPFAIVLNYHRIGSPSMREHKLLPAMFVSPSTFEIHLKYLCRRYTVVTMRQLMQKKSLRKKECRPLCVITFDDGWKDNYDIAFPLLKKYGLPATVFISTDFIGTERAPWFYDMVRSLIQLSDLLEREKETRVALSEKDLPAQIMEWAALPENERLKGVERLLEGLKHLPGGEVENAASTLFANMQQHAHHGDSEQAMLDWDNVREMQKCGIEIGSHGASHSILTHLEGAQVVKEVTVSKMVLERELRETVVGFSYPNGDHADHIRDQLQKSGYTYACTIKPGNVDLDMPSYQIKRLLLHDDNTYTTALFACHMAGLFNRGRE